MWPDENFPIKRVNGHRVPTYKERLRNFAENDAVRENLEEVHFVLLQLISAKYTYYRLAACLLKYTALILFFSAIFLASGLAACVYNHFEVLVTGWSYFFSSLLLLPCSICIG